MRSFEAVCVSCSPHAGSLRFVGASAATRTSGASAFRVLAGLFAVCLLGILSSAEAVELPVIDDAGGVTCDHHIKAVRASWINRGGDWIDANGAPQGNTPFATATISNNEQQQSVALDVTALARGWHARGRPAGFVLLRPIDGSKGVVDFASRESERSEHRPALRVQWSDGSVSSVNPSADTSIDCTTAKSLGGASTIRVGGRTSTLLAFPLKTVRDVRVERATLLLSTERQTGGAVVTGVFEATPPWMSESSVRTGLASRYPGDEGIDRDPAVYFATGFGSGDWRAGWPTVGRRSIADTVSRDDDNRFEPLQGNALRVRMLPHQNLGLDLRYEFAHKGFEEPEQAYFRYYLRLGNDWNPVNDGGKLPGFAGTYNRAGWGLRKVDGTNGWSALGAFFRQAREGSRETMTHAGIGNYAYHMGVPGRVGDHWGWGLGRTGRLERNRWYSVEQFIRLNTPGRSDGVMRAWIDGELVMERAGMRFRDVPELRIESVWFNVYHGGVAKPASPLTLYIDNVVISREYVGPMKR